MIRILGTTLTVAALTFGSCGYTTESMLPRGVDTVAIDIFGNETFYREIEFDLARELAEEVNHRTAYRITRRRNADAVLTGRILSVRRPTLVEGSQDRVSEQAVILKCEVALTENESGHVLDAFVVQNRAEFIVERGETLQTAFAEAIHDLAEQIINELQRKSFLEEMGRLEGS